jgi:PAS domain-containing protein
MTRNQDEPRKAAELRRQAEEQLKRRRSESTGPRTEMETTRLVHELEVHEIELEMQNEELLQARAHSEELLARYTDLYDFAPTGYFTLTRDGTIVAVNLTGVRLVGLERAQLLNRRFGFLTSEGDRPVFNAFLEKTFESRKQEFCEMSLVSGGRGVRGPAGVPRRRAGCHRPPQGRGGARAIDSGAANGPDPCENVERSVANLRPLQKDTERPRILGANRILYRQPFRCHVQSRYLRRMPPQVLSRI